jgi:anti-sigma B factor antagonist
VDLTVQSSQVGDVAIVSVAGDLDVHSAPVLQAEVAPLSRREGGRLVVDLSGVEFIDSTGLGVLVGTLKHVREAAGSLDVVVSAPRVRKVFTLTGLDVVIPLHGTLDEATAAARKAPNS